MRKHLKTPPAEGTAAAEPKWLDLERLASVEVSSEDPQHPVEEAFVAAGERGWRAAAPGPQTIRLSFDEPQRLRRIRLAFAEPAAERTQEFVLRWIAIPHHGPREVVRQQWTFSPGGSVREVEDYQVELDGVSALELFIVPDIGGGQAKASLMQWRVA